MDRWDAERWDRTRVACLLLGEPEPPPPKSFYSHALVSLAALNEWRNADRVGGMLLPLEIAEEGWASHYEFMDGWHSNPHTVGLLSHLDANPYDQESNRTAFDNGRALMTTRAGQQYRRYIETCRRKAMATAPGIRVP